jgi:hypothetical protein
MIMKAVTGFLKKRGNNLIRGETFWGTVKCFHAHKDVSTSPNFVSSAVVFLPCHREA